jgi:hypothetical protein
LRERKSHAVGSASRPDSSFNIKAELPAEKEIFGSDCGARAKTSKNERDNVDGNGEHDFRRTAPNRPVIELIPTFYERPRHHWEKPDVIFADHRPRDRSTRLTELDHHIRVA